MIYTILSEEVFHGSAIRYSQDQSMYQSLHNQILNTAFFATLTSLQVVGEWSPVQIQETGLHWYEHMQGTPVSTSCE